MWAGETQNNCALSIKPAKCGSRLGRPNGRFCRHLDELLWLERASKRSLAPEAAAAHHAHNKRERECREHVCYCHSASWQGAVHGWERRR